MAYSEVKRELLYLFGSPASGKSTLFATLTEGLRSSEVEGPVPHVVWSGRYGHVVELGKKRESFSGTDALSMSIQPRVLELLQEPIHPRVMGEGDRLSNRKFFDNVRDIGYELRLFWLDTPVEILEDRRSLRTLSGSVQNRTWLRGRDTKVRRLASELEGVVRIPGELPLDQQVRILFEHGGDVTAALGDKTEARV